MAYCIYDWAVIGPAVLHDYQTGQLSVSALLDKHKIKRGALWAFLKKKGVQRNGTAARAIAIKHGRLKIPVYRSRMCAACQKPFTPESANHKVCQTCTPNKRFRILFKKYGVTKPTWDKLLRAQKGRCALCPREPSHVDHDHGTYVVRGLLCATCNQAMRAIDDASDWGDRACRYRSHDTGFRANEKWHRSWAGYTERARPRRRAL